jgi:hypothetical protein
MKTRKLTAKERKAYDAATVNGFMQTGDWPSERLAEAYRDHCSLTRRAEILVFGMPAECIVAGAPLSIIEVSLPASLHLPEDGLARLRYVLANHGAQPLPAGDANQSVLPTNWATKCARALAKELAGMFLPEQGN